MTCRLTRQQVRSCEEDLFCPSQPLFPAQKLCYVLVPNTLLDQNQNTAFQAWAHGKQGCKQNLAQCYPLLSDYQYTSAGRYWCHEHSFCILIVFLFILLSLLRDLFFFPFFLFFSLLFFFSSFSFLYFFSFLLFSLFFFSLSLLSLFFFFSLFFPFSFSFILSFPSFFFLIFSSSFFFFNFFLITFSLPLFLVFSFFFFYRVSKEMVQMPKWQTVVVIVVVCEHFLYRCQTDTGIRTHGDKALVPGKMDKNLTCKQYHDRFQSRTTDQEFDKDRRLHRRRPFPRDPRRRPRRRGR